MVRTEYDYAIFPRHFKKVHARNCNIKKEKKSKDERRARLDEKI